MTSQLFLLQTAIKYSMRLQRVFRNRLNLLDAYSGTDLIARYSIALPMYMNLLDRFGTFMIRPTGRSHAIPTTQLAVTFLSTVTFQTVVASSRGISQCSVSRSIVT